MDGEIISIGDSLLLNSNNYTIGNHEIQLTVLNECGEETTSEDLVIEKCDIPNVITPNGDGFNDVFDLSELVQSDSCSLLVFNRWGAKVAVVKLALVSPEIAIG